MSTTESLNKRAVLVSLGAGLISIIAVMPSLLLIRGLPGSGKSTLAEQLSSENTNAVHLEADMYFVDRDGNYCFDPLKLKQAHDWCQNEAEQALSRGHDVIISNTFVERWEMRWYQGLAKRYQAEYQELVCCGDFGSIHDVPEQTIKKMKRRWQQ